MCIVHCASMCSIGLWAHVCVGRYTSVQALWCNIIKRKGVYIHLWPHLGPNVWETNVHSSPSACVQLCMLKSHLRETSTVQKCIGRLQLPAQLEQRLGSWNLTLLEKLKAVLANFSLLEKPKTVLAHFFLLEKIKGRACTLVCTLYSTGKAQKKQIGLNWLGWSPQCLELGKLPARNNT